MANLDEKIIRKMVFVKPGNLKSELGLSKKSTEFVLNYSKDIRIEQTNVFSLQDIRDKIDKVIEEYATSLDVTVDVIVTAIMALVLGIGTARNKINGTMYVALAEETEKYDKLSAEGDGVVDFGPFFREISDFAKTKYESIKTTKNSANGGKLFLRAYSNQSYAYLDSVESGFLYSYLKIAQKTSIRSNKLAALCNPAFPDIVSVSVADAKAFLKIMANYMKRSRSGKSTKDTLGDDINRKDIFLSLASRLYIAHPEAGSLNNSDIEKIWEEGKLPAETEPDYASTFQKGESTRTLLQMIQDNVRKNAAKATTAPTSTGTTVATGTSA